MDHGRAAVGRLAGLAGTAVLVLAACGGGASPTPTPTTAATPSPTAVATPSAAASATDEYDVTVATSASSGKYLAGEKGLALYTFTKDSGTTSNCYDQCATAWPPFVVEATDEVKGEDGVTGTFGTTARTDGTTQVTYNGAPLYYFQGDKAAGDTTGEGLNGVWFLAKP